jgi:hypothetical protein
MHKKYSSDKNLKYSIVILLIFVTVILLYYVKQNFDLIYYVSVPVTLVVNSTTGFNINNSLDFGSLQPGSDSEREIYVSIDKNSRVIIEPDGNIKRFITVSDTDFTLINGYKKKIKIFVNIPPNAKIGAYNGNLKIYFYKP